MFPLLDSSEIHLSLSLTSFLSIPFCFSVSTAKINETATFGQDDEDDVLFDDNAEEDGEEDDIDAVSCVRV